MQALGAKVERTGPFAWKVAGVGVAGFAQPVPELPKSSGATGW
jgi:3-phosphoshikimate 1-carboxyvinyltransferase